MANKLYDEEKIRALAVKIREKTGENPEDVKYTIAQMSETGIDKVYNEGHNVGWNEGYDAAIETFMEELMDWDITAYSTKCAVTVINYHPFLCLYAHIEAYNRESTKLIDEEIIVYPDNSYTTEYTTQDTEWDIKVTGVRFDTDGV